MIEIQPLRNNPSANSDLCNLLPVTGQNQNVTATNNNQSNSALPQMAVNNQSVSSELLDKEIANRVSTILSKSSVLQNAIYSQIQGDNSNSGSSGGDKVKQIVEATLKAAGQSYAGNNKTSSSCLDNSPAAVKTESSVR